MRFKSIGAINAELVKCGYEAVDYIVAGSREETDLLMDLWGEGVEDGEDINRTLSEWGEDDRNVQRDWANS